MSVGLIIAPNGPFQKRLKFEESLAASTFDAKQKNQEESVYQGWLNLS